MRNVFIMLVASTISCSSFAALETGYEVGTTHVMLDHNTKTRANHLLKMGYMNNTKRFGALFGGEVAYTYTPKTTMTDTLTESGYDTHGMKVRAKAEMPITEHFSGQVKGGLGYQKISYFSNDNEGNADTWSSSGYFPTTSAGLVVHAKKNLNFTMMANYDGRKGMKTKDNAYFTLGFNYTLPGNKMV